jgi:Zn-finger nucleic acid-binding protein
MKCPKCGYHRQPRDNVFVASTECPACGIVYAKHGSDKPISAGKTLAVATPAKKRSPVHETSLRQARERVEMRLRNKKNMLQREDLRNRTLERARLITDTVMRQRLEEGAGRENRAEAALGEAGDLPLADGPAHSRHRRSLRGLGTF